MYVASRKQLQQYDQFLLVNGYTIEQLVDMASSLLLPACQPYQSFLIACGPGNNGADGVCLAIKLWRQGKKVHCFVISTMNRYSPALQYYVDQALDLGLDLTFIEESTLPLFIEKCQEVEVLVDGLFGTGLNKEPNGISASLIQEMNRGLFKEIIAIDIPSGIDCNTGMPYNIAVCATQTISFVALKEGYLNQESQMYTGKVTVSTLPVESIYHRIGMAKLIEEYDAKYYLHQRKQYDYKGLYGRVLHITGSASYPGAAMLASKASVYSGSGIVSVWSNKEVQNQVITHCPECTLVHRDHLEPQILNQYDAILLGSGLGLSSYTQDLVIETILTSEVPVVVDGDALTILAGHKEVLEKRKCSLILTPHLGEFRRFEAVQEELVEQAQQFAKTYNVVLVLKGPNTIITDGKKVYRNTTGNQAMATAGSGDVLAGILVSFIGQGYDFMKACRLATYIHGCCGDQVAKDAYTAIPSKVIEHIPLVMHKLTK